MSSRGNACYAGYLKRRTQCNQCTNMIQLKNRRFIRGPAYIKLTVVDRLIHGQVLYYIFFRLAERVGAYSRENDQCKVSFKSVQSQLMTSSHQQ